MGKPFKSGYDVIIIGSGVGGLTAGALLSKAGLSVCILEKEPHVGGYLAGFRRKDFRFDTAIHWLNQCGPEGVAGKIFSILGKDHPVAIPQKRIRRYIGNHHDYLLTNNPEELKAAWIKEFPHEKKGIDRFFKAAKKIGAAFNEYSTVFRTEESMGFWERIKNKLPLIRFGSAFIPHLGYSGEEGITKGLNRYFKEKKLHDIFAADGDVIGCMVPIGWAYYGDFQSPPRGGGQVIPEWLSYLVRYYHNDVFTNCQVEKVLVEGNEATGVVFKQRGEEIQLKANHVIAACDVETLYNKMLPASVLSNKLRKQLEEADIYSSSLTISIALDCSPGQLGFSEELIHISSDSATIEEHSGGDPLKSEIVVLTPSLRDQSLAPEGCGTLTVFMPAYMSFKDGWYTTKDEHGNYVRNEDYRRLKNEIAEVLIDRLSKIIAPDLPSHILFYDVATPVTHWRYTGNKQGTMMGAKPGKENMKNKVARYRTPISNLLIGGQWAELGGGVPIAVKAGTNAALLVLQKENKKAFRLLADYMDAKITAEVFESSGVFHAYDNSWKPKPTPAERKKS
ncbi:phytoene desaturase family protein [Niabella sp. CJ426]|jgi:phytoene dehydrogenase-like protein|uniref:phytoene desaturase family protein n=1 Tax=Niabella sp. CJ426 TaxID=3393740 RepID=UPI003D08A87C